MKKTQAEEIIRSLEAFAKLERQNTDEIGWIALRYSCSRHKAEAMVEKARELTA